MNIFSRFGALLRERLAHPLMRHHDPEDSASIEHRRSMILDKPILKAVYETWYQTIKDILPSSHGQVLELGSGAGFLRDYIPNLITSDISEMAGIDCVADACKLPIADNSLHAIVLVNVFHHLNNPAKFLTETARCLETNGVIVMIEPWMTRWGRFVFTYFHQEAVDLHRSEWKLPASGPLSDANVALPWIVFGRDLTLFEDQFSNFRVSPVKLMMPLSYLVSGGITLRSLAPGWTKRFWLSLDHLLANWYPQLSMFCLLVLTRVDEPKTESRR